MEVVTARRYGPAMLRALAEVVFPATCPGCGGRGEPVCATCARTIRRAPSASPPVGVDALVVPFAYTGVVRELVARVRSTGTVTPRSRGSRPRWPAPSPTRPSTWSPGRRRPRRVAARVWFDQAEVLAAAVAGSLDRPCAPVLRRIGSGHQTGHSRAERIGAPEVRGAGSGAGHRSSGAARGRRRHHRRDAAGGRRCAPHGRRGLGRGVGGRSSGMTGGAATLGRGRPPHDIRHRTARAPACRHRRRVLRTARRGRRRVARGVDRAPRAVRAGTALADDVVAGGPGPSDGEGRR